MKFPSRSIAVDSVHSDGEEDVDFFGNAPGVEGIVVVPCQQEGGPVAADLVRGKSCIRDGSCRDAIELGCLAVVADGLWGAASR